MLLLFFRMENVSLNGEEIGSGRGKNGLVTVQHAIYQPHIVRDLLNAGGEMGLPRRDYNGPDQISVNIPQITVDGPRRKSIASAYIDSLFTSDGVIDNLDIVKGAFVSKVDIDPISKSARGVEFVFDGRIFNVEASKEVILSAGTVNTPKILMLSGIGPKEELNRFKIEPIVDLPVGKNLQDHVQILLPFKLSGDATITMEKYMSREAIVDYTVNRRGYLTTNALVALVFLNVTGSLVEPPDVDFHITDLEFARLNHSSLVISVGLLKPASVGWVRLNGVDPYRPPLINPNYLNDITDMKKAITGLKKAVEFMRTKSMAKYNPTIDRELLPLCKANDSEYFECLAKHYSQSQYHPVGTAKMGADARDSVVAWDLTVHQVGKLRVVDASVMPSVPRANTNAPTVMIAEKASDIIISKWLNTDV